MTSPSPAPRTKPPSKIRKGRLVVALALVAAIVIGILWVVLTTSGNDGSYQASVESVLATSPKNLVVVVHVQNTSTSPVTPNCTIQALTPTGANATTAFNATKPLPAGTEGAYHVTLTVTDTAAAKVTKGDVKLTCS